MSRVIKFRAWNKKERRFLSQEEMTEIGGFYYNYGVEPEPDEFELVQFTGLTDKNGKEIYEGDIVRKTHRFMPVRGKSMQSNQRLAVIEWSSASTRLGFNIGANRKGKTEYEVIGNVFENPELTKQS